MGSQFVWFAILIALIGGFPHSDGISLPAVELEVVEYEMAKGLTLQHSLPLEVLTEVMKECTVTTPAGEVLQLYPTGNSTDSTIQFDKAPLFQKCGVKIGPLTTNHNGKWILRGVHDVSEGEESEKTIFQEIQLKIQEEFTESEETFTSSRGGHVHHVMPTREYTQKLISCSLKTNKGISFELFPTSNVNDDNINFYQTPLISVCGIDIANISEQYIGKWELQAVLNSPDIVQNQAFEIKIMEKVNTIPTMATVYEGSDVSFELSEVVKNHKCTWKSPLGQETILDTPDTCAFKLTNVSMKDYGTWTGSSVGEITLFGYFNLDVKEIPKIQTAQTLRLGYSGDLSFGPSDAIFCSAISPMGEKFPHRTGVCKINVDKVTHKYDGIWQAHVSLPGKLNTVIYYYEVKVEEPNLEQLNDQKVISSFSSSDKDLRISCSMIVDSFTSCHLLRSDGKLLSIFDGVGYEQYNGFTKSEKLGDGRTSVTCGLAINNPTAVDKKNWKCLIVHGEDKESSATIKFEKSSEIEDSTQNIATVKGSTYELQCSVPNKINYCWFFLPNKTHISVYPGSTFDDYEYYGNGLDVGDCGIKIKKASVSDTGTWKCSMGVESSSDLQADIDVKVYDNVLIPMYNGIVVAHDITIGCKTFDNSPVDYCRFVRPDGLGINPSENDSMYGAAKTNFEAGICELEIFRPLYNDLGSWKCAAKSTYENEEYHSEILIVQYYSWVSYTTPLYTFMWVMLTLLILLLITILCVSNRGRRMRRRTVEFTRSFSIKKENLHTPE